MFIRASKTGITLLTVLTVLVNQCDASVVDAVHAITGKCVTRMSHKDCNDYAISALSRCSPGDISCQADKITQAYEYCRDVCGNNDYISDATRNFLEFNGQAGYLAARSDSGQLSGKSPHHSSESSSIQPTVAFNLQTDDRSIHEKDGMDSRDDHLVASEPHDIETDASMNKRHESRRTKHSVHLHLRDSRAGKYSEVSHDFDKHNGIESPAISSSEEFHRLYIDNPLWLDHVHVMQSEESLTGKVASMSILREATPTFPSEVARIAAMGGERLLANDGEHMGNNGLYAGMNFETHFSTSYHSFYTKTLAPDIARASEIAEVPTPVEYVTMYLDEEPSAVKPPSDRLKRIKNRFNINAVQSKVTTSQTSMSSAGATCRQTEATVPPVSIQNGAYSLAVTRTYVTIATITIISLFF